MKKTISAGMAVVLLATLTSGCAVDPNTGQAMYGKTLAGGGLGAAVGAGVGALAGGKKHRAKGALIGAAVGGVLGTAVGAYLDRQASQLQQQLQGTGMQVVREPDAVKVVVPGSVAFATNSAQLTAQAYQALSAIAASANQDPTSTLDIVGHTDSQGAAAFNQQLSQARAQSVAQYLSGQGIALSRISSRGVGSSMPIASNDTDIGRAQNRRVEITLHPGSGAGQGAPQQQPGYGTQPPPPGYGQPPQTGYPQPGYQQPATTTYPGY